MLSQTKGTDNSPDLIKGLLGKAVVKPGDDKPIYTLNKSKDHASVFINILNISAVPADIVIYVSDKSNVTDADLIEKGVTISPTGLLTRSVVRLSAGESIYIVSTANVVARIEGYEGVIL